MDCIIPSSFTAGLTFDRLVTLTAYPASDGWALRLILRGPAAININSEAEGNQHRLAASNQITANWAPGQYEYTLRAQRPDEAHDVATGFMVINPDLEGAQPGHDGRSHARRVLEAIEAVIERRASLDQERYRINNRELYRTPIHDLLKLRDQYRAEVRREMAAQCGKSLFGGVVRVRLK